MGIYFVLRVHKWSKIYNKQSTCWVWERKGGVFSVAATAAATASDVVGLE